MCASCGCGEPNEQHGDSRHITLDQINQAASAAEMSTMEVAQNIMQSVQQSGGSMSSMGAGQSNQTSTSG
jgi:hypothetical protein